MMMTVMVLRVAVEMRLAVRRQMRHASDQAERTHLRGAALLLLVAAHDVTVAVAAAASFTSVAVDCRLQLHRRAQASLLALVRVQVLHVLCSQGEGGGCDRRWQMQAFDDLLPEFFVDDVDKASALDHQIVQLVKV